MPEGILPTDVPGLSQVEEGLTGPDTVRSIIGATHSYSFPSLTSPRESKPQYDGRQQYSMPLVVPLTGYRLFTASWILALGIRKAISQSLIPTTLDWVIGITFGLVSYWLGLIEDKRPEVCPGFFEVDLAPSILKFFWRDDVLLWIASALPLFLAEEIMSFLAILEYYIAVYATREATLPGSDEPTTFLDFYRPRNAHGIYQPLPPPGRRHIVVYSGGKVEIQLSKDCRTQVVLGISMAVFLFCLHGLRVVRPKGFEGNRRYASLILGLMIAAQVLFLGIKGLGTNSPSESEKILILMTMRLYIWMMPCVALPLSERRHREGSFSGHPRFLRHIIKCAILIWCVFPVVWEVGILYAWGIRFPQTLFSSFFVCLSLVCIWKGFFLIISPSSSTSGSA